MSANMNKLETKNALLSKIESLLKSIMKNNALQMSTITAWRWEQPDIELRWYDSEKHLWKNVHLLIQGDSFPFTITIDINAWHDIDIDGSKRLRKWNSKKVTQQDILAPLNDLVEIEKFICEAYALAKNWNESGLKTADISQER